LIFCPGKKIPPVKKHKHLDGCLLMYNQIEAQRSGFDLEKEKQHHRSIGRRLRRLMTSWCCFDVAGSAGFEPAWACTLTVFESCSHLVLSCLLWSVAAVLETVKTLVLKRVSDAPTGIDQLHIRKN